jgi:dihydroneopterin aldolase
VGPPVTLIEALAENISKKILKVYDDVEKVKITVHKPRAPISVPFGDVSITIKRER